MANKSKRQPIERVILGSLGMSALDELFGTLFDLAGLLNEVGTLTVRVGTSLQQRFVATYRPPNGLTGYRGRA